MRTAILWIALLTGSANAFTVSSAITTACHEPITMAALRTARAGTSGAEPLVSMGRNDKAIVDDVAFIADADMRDLGAVALLLGVRDNDLKGRDPNEIDSLALIHGDPEGQREHCLRAPNQDEPGGTQAALAECRAFIREKFAESLDGLDGNGRPTLDIRTNLPVGLSLRGKTQVALPLFYVRMGQALHTLQDGFSHTYRPADRRHVLVTLNYVDVVDKNYASDRDGPEHSMELDKCDGTDPVQQRNRELATTASTEVIQAALDDNLTRGQKLEALDVLLDKYLGYQNGCTASNKWCDAPEAALAAKKGALGCGATGAFPPLLAICGLLVALLRKRRVNAGWLVLALMVPFAARAQEGAPPVESPQAAEQGTVVPVTPAEVSAVQKETENRRSVVALHAGGGVSLYNTAVSGAVGIRFRFSDYLQLGLDGEINGWYGLHAKQLRTGAANIYASLIVRFPMKFERINLRSSLSLGVAIQMLDLAGVPSGSTGLFAGINPLGVEFKVSKHFYVVLYPLGLALPVTQLKGAPFAFPQFRTSLGIEIPL